MSATAAIWSDFGCSFPAAAPAAVCSFQSHTSTQTPALTTITTHDPRRTHRPGRDTYLQAITPTNDFPRHSDCRRGGTLSAASLPPPPPSLLPLPPPSPPLPPPPSPAPPHVREQVCGVLQPRGADVGVPDQVVPARKVTRRLPSRRRTRKHTPAPNGPEGDLVARCAASRRLVALRPMA